MFIEAIEKITQFTRPIHTISRLYGSKEIIPGTATLFFVNEEGVALTCKHIVNLLKASEEINKKFTQYKEEREGPPTDVKIKKKLKILKKKYEYTDKSVVQIKNSFLGCVDKFTKITCHAHPKYDLAILKFQDITKCLYNSYAILLKDSSKIKQGKYLCRLGYPFPEFSNFQYNEKTDDIEWTQEGRQDSPNFPIDGIVTRKIIGQGKIIGIEMSTPGLRGQSGGPLFDINGVIYGMQHGTNHLHLGFDIENKEILIGNKKKPVSNYPFLHVGHCVHIEIIKEFLKEHKIKFYEE